MPLPPATARIVIAGSCVMHARRNSASGQLVVLKMGPHLHLTAASLYYSVLNPITLSSSSSSQIKHPASIRCTTHSSIRFKLSLPVLTDSSSRIPSNSQLAPAALQCCISLTTDAFLCHSRQSSLQKFWPHSHSSAQPRTEQTGSAFAVRGPVLLAVAHSASH